MDSIAKASATRSAQACLRAESRTIVELRGRRGGRRAAVSAARLQSMSQGGPDRVTSGYPAGAAAADGFSGVARDRRSVYTHSTCI